MKCRPTLGPHRHQSLPSNPFPVIMYPQCTYSKAIEHGTLPPHPLFNNPGTSGKQNFAWYHITEIMPRSKCTVRGSSLPLFVPPTTANFSTSIALCVYLPQEGSFGISQELCVGEVARRSRGNTHRTRVCFCILVFASRTKRRTTLNLKPWLQNTP
jgi:hypothetical protein